MIDNDNPKGKEAREGGEEERERPTPDGIEKKL